MLGAYTAGNTHIWVCAAGWWPWKTWGRKCTELAGCAGRGRDNWWGAPQWFSNVLGGNRRPRNMRQCRDNAQPASQCCQLSSGLTTTHTKLVYLQLRNCTCTTPRHCTPTHTTSDGGKTAGGRSKTAGQQLHKASTPPMHCTHITCCSGCQQQRDHHTAARR